MKKENLTRSIIISMILGLIVGVGINLFMQDVQFVQIYFVDGLFTLIGNLFMNTFKMMTVPIVFFSLIVGASNVGDIKKFGKLSTQIVLFYLATTAIAITIALGVGFLLNPGLNVNINYDVGTFTPTETTGIIESISNLIPKNPFLALSSGNMLQIIFFALLLGVSITMLGDKTKDLKNVLDQTNEALLNIMILIMYVAPIGVFSLMAKVFAIEGFGLIIPLSKYFVAILLALLIQLIIVYPGLIAVFAKLNPIQFLKNAYPPMAFGFSTSSSAATIPVTLDAMKNNHGVDPGISSFTIPLGSTVNMDGTSIMQGVAVVLIAQLSGVELTIPMLLTVIVTATIASIGTASVPSAGLVMLSMVLVEIGLDPSMIALILGIDRLLDMSRTAVNLAGDQACTVIVAKKQNALNEAIYNRANKPK